MQRNQEGVKNPSSQDNSIAPSNSVFFRPKKPLVYEKTWICIMLMRVYQEIESLYDHNPDQASQLSKSHADLVSKAKDLVGKRPILMELPDISQLEIYLDERQGAIPSFEERMSDSGSLFDLSYDPCRLFDSDYIDLYKSICRLEISAKEAKPEQDSTLALK